MRGARGDREAHAESRLRDLLGVEATVVGPDDVVAGMAAAHAAGVGAWNGGAGTDPVALAGRLTGRAVERAVELWRAGSVDAIVTGPGDKRALNAAGYRFPGHTELLRDLTGAKQVAMMLASDRLRVVLVTTHLPLREALSKASLEVIERVVWEVAAERLAPGSAETQKLLARQYRAPWKLMA